MRLLLILILLAAALPLSAVTIFGLRADNHLVSFDSATPGTVTDIGLITGFGTETPVGVDFRPLDGVLYMFTADAAGPATLRTYTLNTGTAVATLVGATAATVPGLSSTASTGVGFNATVDRVRVVNESAENFRTNPSTGALAADDTNLTPGTPQICAVAYDRSFAGATLTTLFGIDANTDMLVMIGGVNGSPSANTGAITNVGPLGFNAGTACGLDIDANGDVCYASLGVAGVTGLYTINLATGAATLVGAIGGGANPFQSIAVQPSTGGGGGGGGDDEESCSTGEQRAPWPALALVALVAITWRHMLRRKT